MENPIPKNVHSFVVCDATGEVTLEDGPEASRLAETLPFFSQLADMLGDAMGLGGARSVQLLGKKHTTLCQAKGDHFYGAVFEGSQVREVMTFLDGLEEVVGTLTTDNG
jgi:hypothetical protein